MEEILEFLTALKENNNREWFQTHKEKYQSARKTYVDFVGTLIKHLSIIDKQVLDLEAKDSVFRIYRDVRFSNNKTPYKTAFGAYMAKAGEKANMPAITCISNRGILFSEADSICPHQTFSKK